MGVQIVKIMDNGVVRDMTPEEIAEFEAMQVKPDYKESIISAIRQKYSVDDELAILRQRDSKPEEFQEYFDFVESIKNNLKDEQAQELQEAELAD